MVGSTVGNCRSMGTIFPAQRPVAHDWVPDFEYSMLGREYLDEEEGPWAGTDIDHRRMPLLRPPQARRPPGRPKNRRIRSRGETPDRVLHCSRCGGTDHNRRTCKEVIGATLIQEVMTMRTYTVTLGWTMKL
jgi:hypothetical protein